MSAHGNIVFLFRVIFATASKITAFFANFAILSNFACNPMTFILVMSSLTLIFKTVYPDLLLIAANSP